MTRTTERLPHHRQPADSAARPRAFLVGVEMLSREATAPGTPDEFLDELQELAETLGAEVVGRAVARIREPHFRHLVGSGKAAEIAAQARALQAEFILFDDPLTPSQQRNLEKLAGCQVLDREEVILEIFAQRAQTREAVLQISLAQAQYHLPRLKRRWSHLSRQRGMRGGMGGRGEGEQQIEMDYRVLRSRISRLQKELTEVHQHRAVERKRRSKSGIPMAAIVGYTNAGKSSLLNALTRAGVLVEDRLFATLDPTLRRLRLPNRQEMVVADTVGFVRKLPHLLVEAFKTTLDAAGQADLLIEILDVANPQVEAHWATTNEVLREIAADRLPVITVFNKIDLVDDPFLLQRLRRRHHDALFLSAKTGDGLDALLARLAEHVGSRLQHLELVLPHNRYDLLAMLHRGGRILHEEFTDDGIHVRAAVPPALLAPLQPFTRNFSAAP